MEKVVLDTNILIEVLKGNSDIVQKLETQNLKDFKYIDGLTLLK